MNLFDAVVIVASNSRQAADMTSLIEKRKERGVYPREIEFLVTSDPEEGRIGSFGATLYALVNLERPLRSADRILMIHAGGESRRMPCYVPEGKLFAPLPLESSSLVPPVLLDAYISLFLKYPWRDRELVVASGDVVLDFDPQSVPEERADICGFAAPETLEIGSKHGVYAFDQKTGAVSDFFQKQPMDFLRSRALLEGTDECAVDIGLIAFSRTGIDTLYAIAKNRHSNGETLFTSLKQGKLYLDLYVELLTACLTGVAEEDFIRRVVEKSKADRETLALLSAGFQNIDFTAAVTKKTTFLHFGSIDQLLSSSKELIRSGIDLFYSFGDAEMKPKVHSEGLWHNSVDCRVEENEKGEVLFENCKGVTVAGIEGDAVCIGLENLDLKWKLPPDICLDGRCLLDRRFVLIYGTNDTFKPAAVFEEVVYCGIPLTQWLEERGLAAEDIFTGPSKSSDLLQAKLFFGNPTPEQLKGYIDPSAADEGWRETFLTRERYSLQDINGMDSALAREREREEKRKELLRQSILNEYGWKSVNKEDFCAIFEERNHRELLSLFQKTNDDLLKIYRKRLLGELVRDVEKEDSILSLKIDYLSGITKRYHLQQQIKEDQIVWARAPVRLDLGGGWTDTPPYTLRSGGKVTNVAVNLNGQPPIQVFCKPSKEYAITINSIDLGLTEVARDFNDIVDYNNPDSAFSLPKAALYLLGLTPKLTGTGSLEEALKSIGCGMEITLLCAVPKGSGLGTSSILAAVILAALRRFFGIPLDYNELFRQVLQVEQMLTTGGGWQDQIGGVLGGVKYIESKPGLKPAPLVYQLDPFLFSDPHMSARFTLYYTGVTRLAKNILQEIVDNFNDMTPSYLFTIGRIEVLAEQAREAIALRDMEALAGIIRASWQENKLMHPSTTNDEIEALLEATKGHHIGMKLLGAGGGGFGLFVSASEEEADRLRETLDAMPNPRARLVDMQLNPDGLQVSVS